MNITVNNYKRAVGTFTQITVDNFKYGCLLVVSNFPSHAEIPPGEYAVAVFKIKWKK